jgi:SAM-dependent methyltransferase
VKQNYGREIVAAWATRLSERAAVDVLDIGCGYGADLLNVARSLPGHTVRLHGLETSRRVAELAASAGIDVHSVDIEHARFPFADESFDYAIANQVLEHTKEIFWIVAEAERVLRRGALFCIGVPNLASFHNRVLLALGQEPTTAQLLSPHVRAFTRPGLLRFLERDGFFEVVDHAGANFYPLPARVARVFSRAWPTAAVSLFVLAKKTGRPGSFLASITPEMSETPYFTGAS